MAGKVKRVAVNVLTSFAFLLIVFAALKWLFGEKERCHQK